MLTTISRVLNQKCPIKPKSASEKVFLRTGGLPATQAIVLKYLKYTAHKLLCAVINFNSQYQSQVRCHQNLIISTVRHKIYFYQVISINFSSAVFSSTG